MKVQASTLFKHAGSRPVQEDEALVLAERGIFAVASGFGGPGFGDRAAKLACDAVKGFLIKGTGDRDATLPFVLRSYFSLAGNVLFNALIHANRNLMEINQGKGINERGGASVIAGYLDGDLLALANVGACSAWLFRDGRSVELVTPRTYARLVDPFEAGRATGVEGDAVPLMSLGTTHDLEPEIFEYRVLPGDWILLHSDGMGAFGRERLLGIQSEGSRGDPEMVVSGAVDIFKQNKYMNNVAAIFVVF